MPRTRRTEQPERASLIRALEEARGTRLLTYVTSTRKGLGASMEMDMIRYAYDHLEAFKADGAVSGIDLFIVSEGGDTVMPWRLVTLIREYAERFSLLVPTVAQSAATIAGLGADEIVMHPMGYLGPTDPNVKNDFNPENPQRPGEQLGIAVEDVSSYVELAREAFRATQPGDGAQVLRMLTDRVHPVALGNVKRMHAQARSLAAKLMRLHAADYSEREIGEVIEQLNAGFYDHSYPISQAEARSFGLPVVDAPADVAELMWQLWESYEKDMKAREPFSELGYLLERAKDLHDGTPASVMLEEVLITVLESAAFEDRKFASYEISGYRKDGQTSASKQEVRTSWERR